MVRLRSKAVCVKCSTMRYGPELGTKSLPLCGRLTITNWPGSRARVEDGGVVVLAVEQ